MQMLQQRQSVLAAWLKERAAHVANVRPPGDRTASATTKKTNKQKTKTKTTQQQQQKRREKKAAHAAQEIPAILRK